jgi:hypothetical protein
MAADCNVVVLISGSGSNLQALIDSTLAAADASKSGQARIRAVISNRADAYGLQRAQDAGIATRVLDHKQFDGREAFDAALIEAIDAYNPQLVVLAGFMRILTPGFVRHYAGRRATDGDRSISGHASGGFRDSILDKPLTLRDRADLRLARGSVLQRSRHGRHAPLVVRVQAEP